MNAISKTILATAITLGALVVGAGAVVYSGVYNVAADDPHTRPVHALLETARTRSIRTRAAALQVPADLGDEARIRQGSGNYNAMCMGCHLAPGMAATEMSKGLSPPPPDLSKATVDTAEAFWVIKHGIKASGMPAWGRSMDDEYIWNMAAFLQELPKLSPAQYQALVESSEGHSHGGGETRPHDHAEAVPDNRHDMPMKGRPTDESTPHAHPPGTPADHHETKVPAEPADTSALPDPKAATETDDGHQHQH